MTLAELVSEEKKLKSQRIPAAVFIGFLVGIAVYAATHHKTWLAIIVLIWGFILGSKSAQMVMNIQAEISRRDTIS